MGGTCGIRRVQRRFVVATLSILFAGLFASEPALAQLPLGSSPTAAAPTGGSLVGTVTQVVPTGQVAEQVAPIVGEASKPVAGVTQPGAQATAPVTQAVAPVTAPVAQVVAPIAQAAAPVTQAAPAFESVQPLVDAAVPVLGAAQPLVEPLSSPVVEAAAPLSGATASVIETTAPLLEATAPALRASAPTQHDATPEPGAASTGTSTSSQGGVSEPAPTGVDIPALLARPRADTRAAAPSERLEAPGQSLRDSTRAAGDRGLTDGWSMTFTAHSDDRGATHTAKAGASRTPSPTDPSGPLGFLAAVSAAFASSGALVFLAALAAIILAAAPGLGRRLRPAMAPWPLPIPLPSLERPG